MRTEFSDALYHVTARGDRREDICEDEEDRQMFLSTPGQVVERCNGICPSYCLIGNLYHLTIQTPHLL